VTVWTPGSHQTVSQPLVTAGDGVTGEGLWLAAAYAATAWVALGWPAGLWFLDRYVGQFDSARLHYHGVITPVSAALALGVTAAAALATVAVLSHRVGRTNLAAALKEA
jgi:hypothetical protein